MNGIDMAPAAPPRPGGARAAGQRAADGAAEGFAAALQSALTEDAGQGRRNADEATRRDTDGMPTDQVAALIGGPGTTGTPVSTTPVPGVAGSGTVPGTAVETAVEFPGPHTAVTTLPTMTTAVTTAVVTADPTAGSLDGGAATPGGTNPSTMPANGVLTLLATGQRPTDGSVPPGAAAEGQVDALAASPLPAAVPSGDTPAGRAGGLPGPLTGVTVHDTDAAAGPDAARATPVTLTATTEAAMTDTTTTETAMTTTAMTTTAMTKSTETATTQAAGDGPAGTSAPQAATPTLGAAVGTHVTTPAQAPAPVPVVVGPYPLDQLGPVSGILAGRLRAGEGAHTLVVHVNPAALGPVRVSASMRNGSLSIELTGGAEAARDALRSSLGDLVAALSGSGVDAVVSVSESRQSDAGAARDGDGAFDLSQNARDGSRRGTDSDARGDMAVLPAPRIPVQPAPVADARPGAASRIDVRI